MILNQMDFKSLSSLMQSSRRGAEIVKSLKSYQRMMNHAPKVLVALQKLKLLPCHSATNLDAALCSKYCACCGKTGAFIFLMMAERCCWKCLEKNQAMWAMPRSSAAKCFGLSTKLAKTLLAAYSVPGNYCVAFAVSRPRSQILISVRQAKRLALEIHGSEEVIAQRLSTKYPLLPEATQLYYAYLLRTSLVLFQHDTRMSISNTYSTNDPSNGMVSLEFPYFSLDEDNAESWFWCAGCDWMHRRYHLIPDDVLSIIVPERQLPASWLRSMALREWSKTEFLKHARSYYGVERIVTNTANDR